MTIFRFSGDDPKARDGCWEMIVESRTRAQALAHVEQELRDENRPELLGKIDWELLPRKTGNGAAILHSTLESRCDGN